MILVLVLVVIALLSLSAYTFTELMYTEHQAVDLHGRALQSRSLADSGVEMVKRFVVQEEELRSEAGGIYNNPDHFQGVQVTGDELSTAHDRGRFTVVAPIIEEGVLADGVRFGLEDESTRLNLNTLVLADQYQENGGRTLLMSLPGMTEPIADAILDWIDEDSDTREFGAEADYYSSLDPPYAPKNGPLETVEELLLVRDITPILLFGPDANRNGRMDPQESQAGNVGGIDNSTGVLNRGWSAYLTLYSMERNLRPDGTPRIDLNAEDLTQLYTDLETVMGADFATFIVAYRQNGPYTATGTTTLKPEKANGRKLDLTQAAKTTIQNTLDLVGPNVQVKFEGDGQAVLLETPFPNLPLVMNAFLPILMDNVAANPSPIIPGRINVNQAPKTILMGVPGMTEEIADQIISQREPEVSAEKPNRRSETWLLGEGLVDLELMKQMSPFVCGGGHVYRAQVVGYFEDGGPATRIETVIDATAEEPRVVMWRDISHLGRGFALETLGIEAE